MIRVAECLDGVDLIVTDRWRVRVVVRKVSSRRFADVKMTDWVKGVYVRGDLRSALDWKWSEERGISLTFDQS